MSIFPPPQPLRTGALGRLLALVNIINVVDRASSLMPSSPWRDFRSCSEKENSGPGSGANASSHLAAESIPLFLILSLL